MAQPSRDFGEHLRRSLCAAAEAVAVGDDGLDKIRIRIARAQTSAAADDRQFAVPGARPARASQASARRGLARAPQLGMRSGMPCRP